MRGAVSGVRETPVDRKGEIYCSLQDYPRCDLRGAVLLAAVAVCIHSGFYMPQRARRVLHKSPAVDAGRAF